MELHQRQNRAGRFTSFFATGLFSGCALAYGGFAIADRPAQQSSTNSSGNGTAASDAAAAGDSTGTQSAPSGAGEGAAKADATGTALAEIMVTAQRRSETAQSVPISLQVVTGAQLQQQYIVDASSLARVSPALNFAQGTAPSASAFALRGVSSLAQNAGVQPSTALVVDDVPLVRQGEYVAQLSDIDNIQILNGPQGTLFGKNSTAGVINIVTVQPTREFESWLEGGVTNDNGYSARGMVNVPLSDQIQTRWNFFYQNQNPIVPNRGGPGLDGDVSTGIEGKLAYQITSKLDALVKIDYDHDNSTFLGLVPIHASTNPGETTVLGYTPQWGDAFVNENQKSIGQTITRSGMLRLTYDISDAWRLTSVSSYHYFHAGSLLDTDTTPVGNVLGVGFAPNPTNYKFAAIIPSLGLNRLEDDAHYWSEEDRFNYNSSNLKLVTGVFYQNVDGFYRNASPSQSGANFVQSGTTSDYFDKTASVFGDATYSVINGVNVFAGVRYTHERTFTNYVNTRFLNPISDFNGVTGVNSAPPTYQKALNGGLTKNNVSGRAGIQWQPTSDTNLYASYARGYKGAGIATQPNITAAQYLSVNPETADDYEIGIKQRLFERRIGLDLSIFNETIYDIQETSQVPGMVNDVELLNAGTLRSKGVEGTVDVVATSHMDLKAGFAFLDSYYGDFEFSCNPRQPPGSGNCRLTPSGMAAQNLAGRQAIGAPRWKYLLTADYRDRVLSLPVSYAFQLNYVWTSQIQYALNQNPFTLAPSFGVLNASLDFRTDNGHWDLLLYGKNLTNKFHYDNLLDSPGAYGVAGQLPRDYEVYGGFALRYNF